MGKVEGGQDRLGGEGRNKGGEETCLIASLRLSLVNIVALQSLCCLPAHNTRQWSVP